ncbi:MAG: hypothetical protein GF317_24880 [Candidatus Lokiarchaeota archaeon]|nr:hypothetical protein [Candidatus Lokiarchaeota archaeon]MBD3202594.1 hypothetical protein [Candidatus Lokiarchaeota archaeon]
MRNHKLNRWNWSERAKKWVYVALEDGKRKYKYKATTPREFEALSIQIKELNEKLMMEDDFEKNNEIFKKMMLLSQKMQNMRE